MTARTQVIRAPAPSSTAHRRRAAGILIAAVTAAGLATAFLTGQDGSPAWRVVRVAVTLVAVAAAALAVRRGSAGLRGAVAFAAGIAATTVGAGIGLVHLAKAGWSPATVAGLVALAAGVVLLPAGAASLIRTTRRWGRLVTVPAVLVVVYVALWSGIQAVAATNVPAIPLGTGTPADSGLRYSDVGFPTQDGVRLSAWYVPSADGAAVVLLHGAGSTRADVSTHAVVLARHGFGVLLLDARGHGRSTGRAMDFGWYGDRDISAAVTFLQGRPDVDGGRIAVVGMSMGGEEAIGAAASDPRIRAVVAEGATGRVAADKAFLPEVYGLNGWLQQRIDRVTTAYTDLLTDARPPESLRKAMAATAPRPVLLITGGDVADEGHAARHMQRGNPNVQVWTVPGAGHTAALATRPDDWEHRVTGFLGDALAVAE